MRNLEGKLEKAILKTLTEGKKVSFTHLLEECRKTQPSLSKATLTKYLKILLLKNEINKRLTLNISKAIIKLQKRESLSLWLNHGFKNWALLLFTTL